MALPSDWQAKIRSGTTIVTASLCESRSWLLNTRFCATIELSKAGVSILPQDATSWLVQ